MTVDDDDDDDDDNDDDDPTVITVPYLARVIHPSHLLCDRGEGGFDTGCTPVIPSYPSTTSPIHDGLL